MLFSSVTKYTLIPLILVMVGCASTNCSTNPNEVSRLCAARYKLGANQHLEDHLAARQMEADSLKRQVEDSRQGLEMSQKRASDAALKLAAVDAKTAAVREQADKIAAELKLKQLDIDSRKEDLRALEQRIDQLKRAKSNNQETIAQLNQAQRDLKQTKEEIKVLTDYLDTDLLIRAENALAYD
jgi:chromosome segregation ATPase